MRGAIRALVTASLLLALSSCTGTSGPSSGEPRPRVRADLITHEEMQRGQFNNVYDLVRSLRSRWVQSRGVDTINGRPGEVQVHMDDVRLGGVDVLRSMPIAGIQYIRFFDPVDAAGRWGLDHAHGAIYISTRLQR